MPNTFVNDFCCVGNRNIWAHLEEEGWTVLPWKKDIVLDKHIKTLMLSPTIKQLSAIKNKLPDSLKYLDMLKCLTIPLLMLENTKKNDFPDNLKKLRLIGIAGSKYQSQVNWDMLKGLSLEELYFHLDFDADNYMKQFVGFDINEFSTLKELTFSFQTEGNLIENISPNHDIESIHVSDLKDYDLFEILPKKLKNLSISGANSKFKLDKITHLKNLEAIFLNSIQCEIDCELFMEIKSLRKVYVLNSKKILHPEVFIEKNQIKSLQFVNCAGVFKKLKGQIDFSDYEEINIDYS